MLKLATVLDNPGEPPADTRYRDPRQLRQLGYNGIVLYQTTGISGVESPEAIEPGEMRRWLEHQFEQLTRNLDQITAEGLEAYIFYDVLSLARPVVESDSQTLTCKGRPSSLCPASDKAIEYSVRALESHLQRWRQIKGVVLRFGDNDAGRLPYLLGNDIYLPHCPRCSGLGRADRISLVLAQFHKLVVEQFNKRLIARAWNVRPRGMHDSVELCQRLRDRLPGNAEDDRFILSFKFTETDFWRFQNWNPASLEFGRRPIIYELQCQREFESKGAIPNWQVPLWRDGSPEMKRAGSASPAGLAEVADRVNLAGLWAWVRGGGWGGPFIKNETWIDANVVAVPRLADQPKADPRALAEQWIRERLGIDDPATALAIRQILEHSPQINLQGFYLGPFARTKADPWHPNADLIQDDVIDAQVAWRVVQRLKDSDLDELVREKQDAADILAKDRRMLEEAMTPQTRPALEPLVNTMLYGQSLFECLHELLAGLVAYRRFLRTRDEATAQVCRQKLFAAQSYWNHHSQRHGAMPGTASAFREQHFWELTQEILGNLPPR